MDVERIQKINNLALDLIKQGLATDRDEAIAQAEKIFSSTDTEAYNSMKETLQEVKSEKQPELKNNEKQANNPQNTELSQNKIEEILEKNTKYLVKTIKDFQEKINYLEKELSIVKNKLNYTKLPTVKDIVKPTEDVTSERSQVEMVTTSNEITKENNTHPRVGNYNDTDVSIEKFFYMGSK